MDTASIPQGQPRGIFLALNIYSFLLHHTEVQLCTYREENLRIIPRGQPCVFWDNKYIDIPLIIVLLFFLFKSHHSGSVAFKRSKKGDYLISINYWKFSDVGLKIESICGAPRAKAYDPSICFVGRNPTKQTQLRSFGASKGAVLTFISGLKMCGFLRRRVKSFSVFLRRKRWT